MTLLTWSSRFFGSERRIYGFSSCVGSFGPLRPPDHPLGAYGSYPHPGRKRHHRVRFPRILQRCDFFGEHAPHRYTDLEKCELLFIFAARCPHCSPLGSTNRSRKTEIPDQKKHLLSTFYILKCFLRPALSITFNGNCYLCKIKNTNSTIYDKKNRYPVTFCFRPASLLLLAPTS